MRVYKVEISNITKTVINVNANGREDAISIALSMAYNQDIKQDVYHGKLYKAKSLGTVRRDDQEENREVS